LDGDADLKGKISYRCMKVRDDAAHYHLAAAADDQAVKLVQLRDYFKCYTEETKHVAGRDVVVSPLEIIAATNNAYAWAPSALGGWGSEVSPFAAARSFSPKRGRRLG